MSPYAVGEGRRLAFVLFLNIGMPIQFFYTFSRLDSDLKIFRYKNIAVSITKDCFHGTSGGHFYHVYISDNINYTAYAKE
jgi:hypothetical protein